MKKLKEIKLCLDLENQRDQNIYQAVMDFAERHDMTDESEALKAFMLYTRFMGADIDALNKKITGIKTARTQ